MLQPKRNRLWIRKIAQLIDAGSCFIVVGSGHLNYETGLLQLLSKRGYKLTPVPIVSQWKWDKVTRIF